MMFFSGFPSHFPFGLPPKVALVSMDTSKMRPLKGTSSDPCLVLISFSFLGKPAIRSGAQGCSTLPLYTTGRSVQVNCLFHLLKWLAGTNPAVLNVIYQTNHVECFLVGPVTLNLSGTVFVAQLTCTSCSTWAADACHHILLIGRE